MSHVLFRSHRSNNFGAVSECLDLDCFDACFSSVRTFPDLDLSWLRARPTCPIAVFTFAVHSSQAKMNSTTIPIAGLARHTSHRTESDFAVIGNVPRVHISSDDISDRLVTTAGWPCYLKNASPCRIQFFPLAVDDALLHPFCGALRLTAELPSSAPLLSYSSM
jgi:hypothetical protein